ncbi:MAG: ATP-binding protein, partial [Candidatus Atribacteria bacterium]|nr:ATP-binding protein [Candidatus Atribacteria bacterium]
MKRLKPRRIVNKVMSRLLKGNDLIVLLGARQVGKTSIMQLLMDRLLQVEKVGRNKVFYLDLEDMNLLEVLNKGVEEFIAFLKASGADLKERCFVFLDEIQYMENSSSFLKILVDHHKEISVVVSGSSSFSIRNKFKDSLAGRKRIFEIYPLDFGEFVEFKDRKALAGFWNTANWEKARFFEGDFLRYFEEYVIFGGLPRVSLIPSREEKIEYLKDVVNSYIKKDIKDLFRIDNPYAFNRVIKLLALHAGNSINFSNLTTICGISRRTLERYLFILESTFVIRLINPFYTNKIKEVTKMPKLYFMDTGIRNIIVGDLNSLGERRDSGSLVENSVFLMLLASKGPLDEIYYWRTKAGAEMDFVLKGDALRGYEVKYRPFKEAKISRSSRSFISEYSPDLTCICTKNFYQDEI